MRLSLSVFCSLALSAGVAWGQSMVADVTLTPMGSFKAKSTDVKGEAVVSGDMVTAQNIVVGLKNLSTGIELRDRHGRDKYLEVGKYPEIVLVKGQGKGGQGSGLFRWRGVEKEISGTYEVKGSSVVAKFPVKLSDFKVEGINYKGVGVDDEMQVEVSVPARKAASKAPASVPARAPKKK
ncbi:MAG: YceI family protein [Bdellovibrionaceae bacterium]|nr:YceI family protein [Pseudobdellovibrionaceae bacterium]MBX3032778.1 YceI family protein [Pseudobdellovibrionaceae bacterium]